MWSFFPELFHVFLSQQQIQTTCPPLVENPIDAVYNEAHMRTGSNPRLTSWLSPISTYSMSPSNSSAISMRHSRISVLMRLNLQKSSCCSILLWYYINTRISTQTHLIHGAGQVWYNDVIPWKTLYLNFHKSHIIGEMFFIANVIDSAFNYPMIDFAFNHPDEHQGSSTPTTSPNCSKSQSKPKSPKKNNTAYNILQQFKAHLKSLATAFSSMNDTLSFSV